MSVVGNFRKTLKLRFRNKLFLGSFIFIIGWFAILINFPEESELITELYLDKIPHALFGFVVGSFAYVFSLNYFRNKISSIIFALLIISIVGTSKELFDIYILGKYFSISDMIANFAGFLIFRFEKWLT